MFQTAVLNEMCPESGELGTQNTVRLCTGPFREEG